MEIIRNITRRKLRNVLTISGIVIGVLALTTMGSMAENFNALLDGGVKYFSSSIQVGPPDGQSAGLVPLSKVDEIKKVEGVAAAFPTYGFAAKPGQFGGFSFGVSDTIISIDPAENNWGNLRVTLANGHGLDSATVGNVVLGSTIAKEFSKNVGDTIDLPVKPPDAKPDFINRTFKVVGILNITRTAPDNFAYINILDGQMLLKDSLPAALATAIDVTKYTENIDVYGKPGTSLADLDKVAVRIND
jgi:ABC-type lipoprotein release transport system permease subunit